MPSLISLGLGVVPCAKYEDIEFPNKVVLFQISAIVLVISPQTHEALHSLVGTAVLVRRQGTRPYPVHLSGQDLAAVLPATRQLGARCGEISGAFSLGTRNLSGDSTASRLEIRTTCTESSCLPTSYLPLWPQCSYIHELMYPFCCEMMKPPPLYGDGDDVSALTVGSVPRESPRIPLQLRFLKLALNEASKVFLRESFLVLLMVCTMSLN